MRYSVLYFLAENSNNYILTKYLSCNKSFIPKRKFLRSVPCSLSNCPVTSANCWEFGGTEGEDSTDPGCRED